MVLQPNNDDPIFLQPNNDDEPILLPPSFFYRRNFISASDATQMLMLLLSNPHSMMRKSDMKKYLSYFFDWSKEVEEHRIDVCKNTLFFLSAIIILSTPYLLIKEKEVGLMRSLN